MAAGVQCKAIHAALVREHQFQGSYSSEYRLMQDTAKDLPRTDLTVRLSFKPGEAAQVDFGAGPFLLHPDGQMRRNSAFVMTLRHSRHQYVEFVWDQSLLPRRIRTASKSAICANHDARWHRPT
jgi:transposase